AALTCRPVTDTCWRAAPVTVALPHSCAAASRTASAPATATAAMPSSRILIVRPVVSTDRTQRRRRRDRAEYDRGFVAALGILGRRIGVGDDAGTGLHVRATVAQHHGPDRNGRVHVAGDVEVADDAA